MIAFQCFVLCKILDSAPTQLVRRKAGEAGNVVALPMQPNAADG
jgi:hypothetical protein